MEFESRRPIFQGSSCYPLSPAWRRDGAQPLGQLRKIFSVAGLPTSEDVEDFDFRIDMQEFSNGREFLKHTICQHRESEADVGKGVDSHCPHAGEHALHLLGQMLEFSPKKRCTADAALEHARFADIRDVSVEKEIFADIREVAMGFEDGRHMNEEELRLGFNEVLQKFNSGQLADGYPGR